MLLMVINVHRENFSCHQFVCVLDKFDKDLLHIDVCY